MRWLPVSVTVAGAVWFHGNEGQESDPFVRTVLGKLNSIGGRYLGHVPRAQVPELIRSHDVVCVLSRWQEPMSQVIFEGMASGCAVVISRRGGLPQAGGDAAMIVEPEDFGSVVGALRTLATRSDVLADRKRRARARACESSWDLRVDALERLF